MQTLTDVVTVARKIAADEDLAVEVTDEGIIRTTIQNPTETTSRQLHVGEQPIPTTDRTVTALVVAFTDEDKDPAEILDDGDGVFLRDGNEDQLRRMIREALHDVESNTR